MKREEIIMFIMAIVITAMLTFAIYYFVLKKKGTASTDSSKTTQDFVDSATPGEQAEAKKVVDAFKNNAKSSLTEEVVEGMLTWSDNKLAWGATYYKEQSGRSLTKELKDLTIWGWTSMSLDDNHLIDRLENLNIQA